MTDFTHTKKIIMDNNTPEGANAHTNNGEVYLDWYFDQVDAGLADSTKQFCVYEWISDSVCEILVTDQAQADSFIAMAYALADKIGYPLSATVVDYAE
jgi:hypothetical protein